MESLKTYALDYIEIYTPMAKALAYWHTQALGFKILGYMSSETNNPGISSYVLVSNHVTLVLTGTYPPFKTEYNEVSSFIAENHCGVKRIALRVLSVKDAFNRSIENGAIPIKFPSTLEDDLGLIEEASIKLYDNSEITFINRQGYSGIFKPGYKAYRNHKFEDESSLVSVDHIAAEVRINENTYWANYLSNVIGTKLVQNIPKGPENTSGMILNVVQAENSTLTLVIAEPDGFGKQSKVQQNIDSFGPGIHHLAFTTNDLIATAITFDRNFVDFVSFPPSYYDLLRSNADFKDINIDELQRLNILCDKEGETYLFQKFIKPIGDRPFFLYEIVQRINGYNGFALKNINILKKAEEIEIMNATSI